MGNIHRWITAGLGKHWRKRGLSEIWKDRSKDDFVLQFIHDFKVNHKISNNFSYYINVKMHHTSKSVHNNRKVLFQCTISSNMNRRIYSILCQQLNPLPSPCYAPRSICKTHKEIDFKFEGLSQFGISFPIQKLWRNPLAMISLKAYVMPAWFQELVIQFKAFCGPSTKGDFTSHAVTCRFNSVSWSSSHFGHLTVKTAL